MARDAMPSLQKLAIAFVAIDAEARAVLGLCASAPQVTPNVYLSLLEIMQSKLLHAATIAATAVAVCEDEQGLPIPPESAAPGV
jgi:hypothetical protein